MKIIIVGDLYTFPKFEAAAATKRAFSLATGLKENSVDVIIVTLSNIYTSFRGIYNGVQYYLPLERTKRDKFFLIRWYFKIKKYFNLLSFLISERKINDYNILLYSRNYLLYIYFIIFKKFTGTPIYLEVTEIPTYDISNSRIFQRFFLRTLKYFDGFNCISPLLAKYCDIYKNKNARISTILPLSVNSGKENRVPNKINEKYIFYGGTISFRDGIDVLIKAFCLLSERYFDMQLIICGRFVDENYRQEIEQLIKQFNCDNKIILKGFVKQEEYEELLRNSTLFCIPRRDLESTKYAFPSKLIEYITFRKPIICTNVGSIGDFFINNKEIFFIDADDYIAMYEKIIYVLENYENALKSAEEAYKKSKRLFNPQIQTKKLIEIMNANNFK